MISRPACSWRGDRRRCSTIRSDHPARSRRRAERHGERAEGAHHDGYGALRGGRGQPDGLQLAAEGAGAHVEPWQRGPLFRRLDDGRATELITSSVC